MKKIPHLEMKPWSTNDEGEVIHDPPFGDSEVLNVGMNLSKIEVLLNHPPYFEHQSESQIISAFNTRIVCSRPALISMRSDHLQNVVDKICIYDFRSVFEREVLVSGFEYEKFVGMSNSTAKHLLLIIPITGIELIIACWDIEFLTTVIDSH
jgi:hypothetical protein